MVKYFLFSEGDYKLTDLRQVVASRDELWSARLSTGLFGSPGCPAGNRGPKGKAEVLLAKGDEGLRKLVQLGFITCPVCKPETTEGFWQVVGDAAKERYRISSLEEFVDKQVIGFDARHVAWEELLPIIGETPGRLYVADTITTDGLLFFRARFDKLGFKMPPAGYYDATAEGRFRQLG